MIVVVCVLLLFIQMCFDLESELRGRVRMYVRYSIKDDLAGPRMFSCQHVSGDRILKKKNSPKIGYGFKDGGIGCDICLLYLEC